MQYDFFRTVPKLLYAFSLTPSIPAMIKPGILLQDRHSLELQASQICPFDPLKFQICLRVRFVWLAGWCLVGYFWRRKGRILFGAFNKSPFSCEPTLLTGLSHFSVL